MNVDRNNVYLRPAGRARISGWYGYGPYNDEILTLSLFTLLAIVLI